MIKSVHLITIFSSLLLFIIRYVWMIFDSPQLQKKWVKISPHIVDSLLLLSALILTMQINQYPLMDNWLTAKLIALLLYIALGTIALKRGKTKRIKIIAGVFALFTFAYIVSVALSKNSLGFIGLL